MRISNNFQPNFKALMGKRKIYRHQGSGVDSVQYIQHIHPFKDEYKSQAELDCAVDKFMNGSFSNKFNQSPYRPYTKFEVVVEPTLSFTKEEFLYAQKFPAANDANLEALDFIEKGEYNETLIKETSTFPMAIMIEDLQ